MAPPWRAPLTHTERALPRRLACTPRVLVAAPSLKPAAHATPSQEAGEAEEEEDEEEDDDDDDDDEDGMEQMLAGVALPAGAVIVGNHPIFGPIVNVGGQLVPLQMLQMQSAGDGAGSSEVDADSDDEEDEESEDEAVDAM